jgi:hypothetical protein
VDFSRLPARRNTQLLISPRDIFNALPSKAPGFGYLRDVQGQVVDLWESRRSERDLAVKMNTGSGKTIVGLLMLQSCINEGGGPALYVAPNTYLAEQVIRQANDLGIPVVDDVEATRYLSGQAIGVVNVHKLINGRSVFGGPGSGRGVPVPIGSIVVDDAHAALATAEAQTTIVLPSGNPARDRIFETFKSDLRQQSETAVMDIEAGESSAIATVPFWAWASRISDVTRVLHDHREDDALKFTLPIVADALPISMAVFTASSLEIRPPFPPVGSIRSLAEASRRIFLTATLPDDTVLVSDFDADSVSVSKPITPSTASDLGDRLILAPQSINSSIRDEEVRQALRTFADKVNVVVLVPSFRKAERWANVADVTASAEQIASVVEGLRAGHVGLVVLVNKYDGIDLPNDACRILVLEGLPEMYGGYERRRAAALGASTAIVGRQMLRIEQGMGRGVRSAEDYCVVMLLGPRLLQLLADPRNAGHLSPATQAQLELSTEVAEQLEGRDLAEMTALIQQVLDRDQAWVTISRARLAGVTYGPGHVDGAVVAARRAFNAASAGQFGAAVREMTEAVTLSDEPWPKGWAQEQLAVYQQQLDPARAQETLAGAVRLNRNLTKPMRGIPFERLTAAGSQARAAAAYLVANYRDPTGLVIGVNAVIDSLSLDPELTDDFEQGMYELGRHLGFTAQRPDRQTGNGPDVLWAAGSGTYFVIECKSGATAPTVARHDLAQLGQSLDWFDEKYGPGHSRTPLLVHPSHVVASNATPPPDCRIVTKGKLGELTDAVRGVTIALADRRAWADHRVVAEQFQARHLTAGDFASAFSVAPRRTR